jgi:hypothetical protein
MPGPQPPSADPQVALTPETVNAALEKLRPLRPLRRRVLRPEDLLLLDFQFDNLRIVVGARALVRIDATKPAHLIVEHQPQAIADEAFQQVADQASLPPVTRTGAPDGAPLPAQASTPVPPAVAGSRMAGPSRLAFTMPAGQASLEFNLESLLEACGTWPMNLDWAAQPAPVARPGVLTTVQIGDVLKANLDHVAELLKTSLPAEQLPQFSRMLERAAARVSDAILAAERQGKAVEQGDIEDLITRELNSALNSAPAQTEQVRATAKQIIQASSARRTISRLQTSAITTTPERRTAAVLQPTAAGSSIRSPNVATGHLTTVDLGAAASLLPLLFTPHEPAAGVTAIELPYRLIQSPLATAGWAHAGKPIVHGGRTELWHTRLGARGPAGAVDDRAEQPLRAIWSPDFLLSSPPHPFDMSLEGSDRQMLVKLTAGYTEKVLRGSYTPRPTIARQLMLSALGGWLDVDGDWPTGGVNIQHWSHRAALARDNYVRVVYGGFLFPFGHAASLVKVTERKFESQMDGKGRAAFLRQRFFIIVRETTVTYPGVNQAYAGRDFPFKQIDILTKVTPDLAKPGAVPNDRLPDDFYDTGPAPGLELPYREAFWPSLGASVPPGQSSDFLFHLVGVDGAGRRIPFSAPLLFLTKSVNLAVKLGTIIADYTLTKDSTSQPRATRALNGALMQFAPQTMRGDAKGDTNIPTATITLKGASPIAAIDAGRAQFYPGLVRADVVLPAVQRLLGTDKLATVTFSNSYLDQGFEGSNVGQVFLDVSTSKLAFGANQPTDKVGGLITPNLTPSALSRSFGIVSGDVSQFAGGIFNPTSFLPDAKLLGVISLKDVLNQVSLAADPGAVPKLSSLDLPDRVEAGYALRQTNLKSPVELFVPDADGAKSVLDIRTQVISFRDGSPPQTFTDGSLTSFKVNLFGFIILTFDRLHFHAEPGRKPDVDVDLNHDHGVLFGGPLEFVNTLKDIIPSNGFSDPPDLAVTPEGITASYSLGLPTIGVGIFSLTNVSLGAGFDLPFTGEAPSARFNFAERQSPFSLTVSLFGGGGFLVIGVDTGGVREIEAALEFGASISIDLGVASGGVYVKGGVYLHWKVDLVDLEGYVEMGGHLSVVGLISVSLVFHLALSYQTSDGHTAVAGEATLSVEIDILFFSTAVDVSVYREFAGSEADPLFIDFIPTEAVWWQYGEAFA